MGYWPSWTIYLDVLSSGAAGFFQILAAEALYLNILLLGFNLFLPAYPLDGGRIYAASLILVLKLKAMTAAKVTAFTSMLISSGLIIYSAISMLNKTRGNFLLLGLVGVFVFYQGYELLTAVKNNDLGNHPIFGRECYQNQSSGGNSSDSAGQEGEGGAVPAQTDEAVMA